MQANLRKQESRYVTTIDQHQPTHGFTRHGHAVHGRVVDHLPTDTAYQRFNRKIALWLTTNVGTTTCFWIFLLFTLTVLPSVLFAMGYIPKHWVLPAFFTGFGFELLATWLLSTCFQLILLPGLMVGQNLQNEAAHASTTKTFEDVEEARNGIQETLKLLDIHIEGGLKAILDAIESLKTTQ